MDTPARRPLTLCHFTAVEVEPPDFVDLAARAGFAAVSLMIQFPRERDSAIAPLSLHDLMGRPPRR